MAKLNVWLLWDDDNGELDLISTHATQGGAEAGAQVDIPEWDLSWIDSDWVFDESGAYWTRRASEGHRLIIEPWPLKS